MLVRIRQPGQLVYPESDGKPMGENTLQLKWIVALYSGLEAVFRDRPDVFVAADLFWYTKRLDPSSVTAPDVMVVFGRPKGDRSSYKQWEEGGVPPQVVIEIQSPGNSRADLDAKHEFYRLNRVEEYYNYDPDAHRLSAWVRAGRRLAPVRDVDGFVSPRLRVRFDVPGTGPLQLIRPDGVRFRTYLELLADAEGAQRRAEDAQRRAEDAQRRAEDAQRLAEAERSRGDALAARLRTLGVDPDAV